MKKIYSLLLLSTFFIAASAQTSFFDDFESYNAGDYIGAQSSSWTTWSGTTGGSEDAKVVTNQAYSGINSVYFSSNSSGGGPQDVILPFGSQYTSGIFTFSMAMRVTEGKKGYFNFQANPTPGQVWTLETFFESGNIECREGGATLASGSYTPDEWFVVKIEANLSFNIWRLYVDDELKGSFSSGVNKVASMDIFPVGGAAFWIDDVSYDWQELVTPQLNLSALGVSGIGSLAGIPYSPTAKVRNNGMETISSFDISFTHDGDAFTQSISDVSLAPGDYYTVAFEEEFTPAAGPQSMEVAVSNINGLDNDDYPEDDTYLHMVNLIQAAAHKRAVIEEGTGTWCQYCPRGAVTMARMSKMYGSSYIGIAVHNGDPMAFTEYDSGLGLNAFPGGRADRGPQLSDGDFESKWIERMQVAPKAIVDLGAQYNPDTRLLQVVVDAEMLQNATGNYKIALVVIEDNVTGTTSGYALVNAFSGQNVDMGGYENLPSVVPASMMVYDHVARAILPGYGGAGGVLPNPLAEGETYAINFSTTLAQQWDVDEIVLAAFFIAQNGRIDNAVSFSLANAIENGWYDSGNYVVGIQDLPAPDAQIKLYPNPTSNVSYLDIDVKQPDVVKLNISTIDGRIVAQKNYGIVSSAVTLPIKTQGFAKGIYLVQIQIGDAQQVLKLVVD